jgi:SAM-dependent methyltransferase
MALIQSLLRRKLINSSRHYIREANAVFAASLPKGSRVLDAGAGTAPYKPLFSHTDYESADFELVDKEYVRSTYVCDLAAIPVEDHRFDAIIFNQVLEHLPDPLKVLKELHRVLKPGGRIIASAPLFYEEHEKPYDFYRYTQFGWRHLMHEAGFHIETLTWNEGYFGTVAYQLETAARYLPGSPPGRRSGLKSLALKLYIKVLKLIFLSAAVVFYRLDLKARHTASGYPKNYAVVAVRPAGSTQI